MIVVCSVNAVKRYGRGEAFSITVQPMQGLRRIACLEPTKEMVWGYKYKGWSEERYEEAYRTLLSARWSVVKAWMASLEADKDYTLCCYCREGAFCHRHLIVRMLRKWRPNLVIDEH